MQKLIELWKTDCEHCEAVEPVIKELEKEGFLFDRFNVETLEGQKVWQNYLDDINSYNMSKGYDVNFIFTPTFINPENRQILSFEGRAPTKEEIVNLFD